jgi:hypothetical protein
LPSVSGEAFVPWVYLSVGIACVWDDAQPFATAGPGTNGVPNHPPFEYIPSGLLDMPSP